MEDFQKILAQIALENGTTPEEVLHEMQIAIDAAYEDPSQDTKTIQNMITGAQPTPEELIFHIAMMLHGSSGIVQ